MYKIVHFFVNSNCLYTYKVSIFSGIMLKEMLNGIPSYFFSLQTVFVFSKANL